MPVANIAVAFVNPPKGAAKSGSIKTESGDYFRVWADKLALFSPGWKGTIEYTDENWNGKDYRQFKRIVESAQAQMANGKATGSFPDNTKATEMFIMAMMGKAWEGTGTLPDRETCRQHILDLRWAWESAWKVTIPSGQSTTPSIDFSDEVPF